MVVMHHGFMPKVVVVVPGVRSNFQVVPYRLREPSKSKVEKDLLQPKVAVVEYRFKRMAIWYSVLLP